LESSTQPSIEKIVLEYCTQSLPPTPLFTKCLQWTPPLTAEVFYGQPFIIFSKGTTHSVRKSSWFKQTNTRTPLLMNHHVVAQY